MWILPEIHIFTSDPVLKCYIGRLSRNSLELCNLDSCLNKYLHKSVDCHVWYKKSLHKLDPKKFSIETPKKGTSAYLWIFDPIDDVAPSSERIISNTYDLVPKTPSVSNTQFNDISGQYIVSYMYSKAKMGGTKRFFNGGVLRYIA